jgi:SAM-dependent methyltransferase
MKLSPRNTHLAATRADYYWFLVKRHGRDAVNEAIQGYTGAPPPRHEERFHECIHLGANLTDAEVREHRTTLTQLGLPLKCCTGVIPSGIPVFHCKHPTLRPFTILNDCIQCKCRETYRRPAELWPDASWCTPAEADLLHRLSKGRDYLEVGVYAGGSCAVVSQAARSYTGIDRFQFHAAEQVRANVAAYAQCPLRFLAGNSAEVAAGLPAGSFDVALVDGDHTFRGAAADLKAAHRLLRPDGVLLAHDYDAGRCPEVVRAVDAAERVYGWHRFAQADSLVAFRLTPARESLVQQGFRCAPPVPEFAEDRGLVLTGGGAYAPGLYVAASMFRRFHPDLPILLYHRADEWVPGDDFDALGVRRALVPVNVPPGWPVKSWALLYSPFRRTLYTDGDFYVTGDVSRVFDAPSGAFCANYWFDSVQWDRYGVEPDNRPPIDGGFWMLDLQRHWQAAWLFYWLNTANHATTYHWACGDEGQLRVALRACRVDYDTEAHAASVGSARLYPFGVHRRDDKFVMPGRGNPLGMKLPRPVPHGALPLEQDAFVTYYQYLRRHKA